jgi:hypothetical protein
MAFFDVDVDETRHYRMRYRIEADSPEQAILMAEEGNTTQEWEDSFEGILNRGVDSEVTPIPMFFAVEYDLSYFGGDYHGCGEDVFLPAEGLTDENLPERFREKTGHDPVHIVHYCFDEPVDESGESLNG